MIVDYALYQNGVRYTEPSNLQEMIGKARNGEGFVWLGLAEPTDGEFQKVVGDFRFHPLAIEDAVTAHQRPKYEEYPGVQAFVLKTVFYEEKGSQEQPVKFSVLLATISSLSFGMAVVHLW
jgi:magnesium transporter